MVAVFLYVDGPVASLQFDLDTHAVVALEASVGAKKSITTNRLVNGMLRVIIYGFNQDEFVGKFAALDGSLNGQPKNVVGARGDGTDAGATVATLRNPENVKATIR